MIIKFREINFIIILQWHYSPSSPLNDDFVCFRQVIHPHDNDIDDAAAGHHVQQGDQGHRRRAQGTQVQNQLVFIFVNLSNSRHYITVNFYGLMRLRIKNSFCRQVCISSHNESQIK